jgi:hypothetical protein
MNKSDRCDACGVEALARVRSELSLRELLFCGHHLNSLQDALDSQRFYVVSKKVLNPA